MAYIGENRWKERIGLFLPANTLTEMQNVNNQIVQLSMELESSDFDYKTKEAFDKFVYTWEEFYLNNKDNDIRLALNSTWDQTQRFADQVNQWRKKLINAGLRDTSTTSLKPLAEMRKSPKKSLFGPWPYIIVGGAGAYLIYLFYKERTKQVSARTGLMRAMAGKPKSHHKGRY